MVTGTPTIAVIVPNWNDARYLPRCLRSVLEQEVPADELIVVDDRSTDDSIAVINAHIVGSKSARLVANPVNLGTNGALNEGLRCVKSDYVLFLASNDFVLPGIFARAKACLARSPHVGLWSAMVWLVNEEDRPIRLHPSPVVALRDRSFDAQECIKLAHRFGNWFTGTTLIYNREFLRSAGGFDPAYGGLSDLITALVVASRHGAAYTPAPFAAVRVHAGSFLSGTLKDVSKLDAMIYRLSVRGPQLSPELFSNVFLRRTALRFRFAAVRASAGEAIAGIAKSVPPRNQKALLLVARIVPMPWRKIRVAASFLILRPFDILPTVVNRLLGWTYVRLRLGRMSRGNHAAKGRRE